MKTLYLGAMKSSGSAEWHDGGVHKALTALRKGAAGSYVILFLTTLTDVCFSNFSAAVNESRAEIYLIQQNLPACNQKLRNKKTHSKAIGLLTPVRQLTLRYTSLNLWFTQI